jgi:hypothetical protein
MISRKITKGAAARFILSAALILSAGLLPSCVSTKNLRAPGAATVLTGDSELVFDINKTTADIENYLEAIRAPNGLVPSFTDSSTYVFAKDTGHFHKVYYGKMGYLEDNCYTYDMSLAAIGFLLLGKKDHAEKVLSILENDFYLKKNGRIGLYNSYLLSSKIPVDDLSLGMDGDRIHAGPTLWVALAALNHVKIERSTRYLEFVLDIINWCRSDLSRYRFPDGEESAVSMGFGWGPDWSKIFSTEHNIDYYSAIQILRDIYKESPEKVRDIFRKKDFDDKWLERELSRVGRFIRETVFNSKAYCFVAGVNENGVDGVKILDGTSWGLGGIGPEFYEKAGIDIERLVENSEKIFRAQYTLPDGHIVEGFDITDFEGTGSARKPLVWFEGTGQMIAAYGELARYYHNKGDNKKARRYKNKAIRCMNDMYRFSGAYKMDGALPYMAVQPQEKQIMLTLRWEWEIPRGSRGGWVRSLSSSMWFLFALKDLYNPMRWQ